MAEYRNGYKVDPETGLNKQEERAGLTRAEAEAGASAAPPGRVPRSSTPNPPSTPKPARKHKTAWIVGGSVGGLLLLLIIVGVALGGGGDSSKTKRADDAPSTANTSPPPPPAPAPPPPPAPEKASEPKKASNGDDAADLRNRAQQAVNRAEVCLVALQLAVKDTSSAVAMASNLQDSRSVCDGAKTFLVTENMHGFFDQATELFGSADEGKAATGAGLAYLDTLAPSKLADFRRHVQDASAYYTQGLSDLNARLSELGVAHVKG